MSAIMILSSLNSFFCVREMFCASKVFSIWCLTAVYDDDRKFDNCPWYPCRWKGHLAVILSEMTISDSNFLRGAVSTSLIETSTRNPYLTEKIIFKYKLSPARRIIRNNKPPATNVYDASYTLLWTSPPISTEILAEIWRRNSPADTHYILNKWIRTIFMRFSIIFPDTLSLLL